jgi:nitroreductase
MDFYEVIKKRRSIRSYKSDPIPDDSLARIIAAVNAAPTACNLQPFVFKLVKNRELKAALAATCRQDFPAEAPALLAVIVNQSEAWKRDDGFNSADTDMAIAMEHFQLAAAEEGLGSCWICAFNALKAAEVLQIKSPCRVAALAPLGYPAAPPRPFVRKAESQIFEVID